MLQLLFVTAQAEDAGVMLFSCGCSLVMMLVFGAIGYGMGKTKAVGPVGGALLGAFLGFIGLIIVAVSGDAQGRGRDRRRSKPLRRGPTRYGEPEMLEDEPEKFEMRISCPKCSKHFTITDPSRAGQKARCDACKTVFKIPEMPA